jgi:lipoate-protein ligase A
MIVKPDTPDPRRDPRVALRVLSDLVPAPGPTNMAIDQALLESVIAGAPPTLRFYRWDPPTLSFGRNQPARGLYDTDRAGARGIAFVRRPTGGQAVLHDDELTYALVAPISVIGRPRSAYVAINRALVAGLRRVGVDALVAAGATLDLAGHDWQAACFRRPARGEVEVGGAKLVGSAQRTESRTILQHGSILIGGSQAPAEDLLAVASVGAAAGPWSTPIGRAGTEAGPTGWTTLERELGVRPSADALVTALVHGFRQVLDRPVEEGSLSPAELEAAGRLEARFAADAWTWRR